MRCIDSGFEEPNARVLGYTELALDVQTVAGRSRTNEKKKLGSIEIRRLSMRCDASICVEKREKAKSW